MSRRTLHGKSRTIGLALLLAGQALACGAVKERAPNEPDCSLEDAYEFSTPLIDAELGSPNHPITWFGSGDLTPNCLPGVVDGVPVGDVTLDDAGLATIKDSVCTIQENQQGSPFFVAEGSASHLSVPGTPEYAATVKTPVHRSLVFHSEGCTFWGSNASHGSPATPIKSPLPAECNAYTQPGKLEQPTGYWDGSQFEGIAFWARTPGVSNHSVTIALNNADTALITPSGTCYEPHEPMGRCTSSPVDATAGLGQAVVDYQSGTATAGGVTARVPQLGECGNSFQRVLTTTPDWQFYTLPFDTFFQLPYPNRISSGFDSSTVLQITVMFPKEVRTELWIANFRFYRKKGAANSN